MFLKQLQNYVFRGLLQYTSEPFIDIGHITHKYGNIIII